MNKVKTLIVVAVSIVIAISCTKDKIVTQKVDVMPVTDSLAPLLAGASGASKNWKLTSVTYTINGTPGGAISLASCVTDNIVTFTNDATQDFIQTEGAGTNPVKCNSADSTVVESGNWAFTNNGKNLVIEGEWFDNLANENDFQYVFTALGESSTLVQLSTTTLVISYSFTNSDGKYVVTATFSPA